jgi:stearoyl-CoA desaturase (delta-9 desaturase)
MNHEYPLLIVLPMIVLGTLGILTMVLTSSYWWLLLTFVFWVLMSGLGISVGFHRIYSHQCYDVKPWLDNLILFLGTIACQYSSLNWVAVHMGYHHRYSDTDKDPHTPTKGFWNAFLGWTTKIGPETISYRYAVKLIRKPNHVFFHKYYFRIVWGFAVAFIILFGLKAFLFGYCIAAMISILQDNLVNVLGHSPKLGYRNFETKDFSSNFLPLGYFGWGQGWHNNHHQYPDRFNFGIKWWEFDPCRIFIPFLKFGSYDNR